MITIIHYKGGYKAAYNSQGKMVLGTGYFTGRQKPNFPVPAISEIYHWDYSLYILLMTFPFSEEDEELIYWEDEDY